MWTVRRVFQNGGSNSRRIAGWLMFFVAGCLAMAACTGSGDVDLESGDADLGSDASPSESDDDESDAVATDDENETPSEDTADENDGDGDEPAAEPSAGGFLAPVRFENGEHESSEPIDQQIVEEKLAEASLAAYNNWRTCIGIGLECDYRSDVAPLLSGIQRVRLGQNLNAYVEGERVVPGDQDSVAVATVEALELTPPILGQVSLCVVDSGVQLIEAGPGREEEILDDGAISYIVGYQLISDEDGIVTVDGEFNVEPFTEDLSRCDEFLQ